MNTGEIPTIGVIGGSGFYTFLDDVEEVVVDTPFGPPSAAIAIGTVAERAIAFLPRHGRSHEFPAHKVNYQANMWALRSVGVRQILAPCAVGGLQPELGPETFVIPDQLVDRTSGRTQTFFDKGACHVAFADPYCPRLRDDLRRGLSELSPIDGGTMVVIDGPRFSTRAESSWYGSMGWSVVNMTGHPEAVLARELAMCYATVALVTDYDAGVDATTSVTQAAVFALFEKHTASLREHLRRVVADISDDRACDCSHAVDGMDLPVGLP